MKITVLQATELPTLQRGDAVLVKWEIGEPTIHMVAGVQAGKLLLNQTGTLQISIERYAHQKEEATGIYALSLS